MDAAAGAVPAQPQGVARDAWGAVAIAGGLTLAVATRWLATRADVTDGIVVGLGFGLALLAVGFAGGWRPGGFERPIGGSSSWVPDPRPAFLGLVGGAVLIGFALVGRSTGVPTAEIVAVGRPAVFLPWVLVTVLVASAEEIVLRGALFTRIARVGGVSAAVLVTSLLFALMHVPTYGWGVVPLDLGVGVWLSGLRIVSRGIAAPAIAHVLADLATWWL